MMQEDVVLRYFLLRNMVWYILPNIVFNGLIPYYSFKDPSAVYLFYGEFCFARFLLPMALLLPFIISFDIMKKTIALSEKGKANFVFKENSLDNRFMLKVSGINGGLTFFTVLLLVGFAHVSLPDKYTFNGLPLAFGLSLLAGSLCVVFTLLPVKKILKNSSPRQTN